METRKEKVTNETPVVGEASSMLLRAWCELSDCQLSFHLTSDEPKLSAARGANYGR
jgi:hypothetical protein